MIKVDNKLNNKIYTTTLRKLCFNNGYYDFEKLEFINNYDDVETNIKIDMDFRNENVMFSIYEKVLKPILGPDLLQPFLHFISRVIAGDCQDKSWITTFLVLWHPYDPLIVELLCCILTALRRPSYTTADWSCR